VGRLAGVEKRLRLAAFMVQAPLDEQLGGFLSGHGNLLVACVKITSYNQHRSAPFLPSPGRLRNQAYSEPGADAFI
jgi:hypothetical protein